MKDLLLTFTREWEQDMINVTKVIMITVITQSLSLGYSFLNATFLCDIQVNVYP